MSSLRMGSVVLILAFVSIGCGSSLKNENAALRRENDQLKAQLADRESALSRAPDPSQLQAMQNEIAQREARIRELEGQLRRPTGSSGGGAEDPSIAGIETSYDRHKGEMTVRLPSDLLFVSGKIELKPASKGTLDKVIAALKRDYAGKKIRVEGHTDSDPITKTKDQWIDNLDLSLNRAATVTRYLVEHGIDKRNIATAGFGDARPKGSKAASRRVEIVVVVG